MDSNVYTTNCRLILESTNLGAQNMLIKENHTISAHKIMILVNCCMSFYYKTIKNVLKRT